MKLSKILRNKFSSINEILSFLIKFILLLVIINSVYFKIWHILSTSVLLLIMIYLPLLLKKSHKLKFPSEFETLLFLFAIAVLFFGRIGGIITPLFFGIAIGFIGFMILVVFGSQDKSKNIFFKILAVISISITLGFLIEIAKYYLKLILGLQILAGDYAHTMRIMSFVSLGSFISAFFGYIYLKKEKGFFKKIFERFEKVNPGIFSEKSKSEKTLIKLIKQGEGEKLEFKSTLRFNIHTEQIDKNVENSSLKTICAFMNSEGGTLLIGVDNSGKIQGIEQDNFESEDKYLLYLSNILRNKIGKEFLNLINFNIFSLKNRKILKIDCKKSNKPVFLNYENKEEFYIRSGPSSLKLESRELIEYIKTRVSEK